MPAHYGAGCAPSAWITGAPTATRRRRGCAGVRPSYVVVGAAFEDPGWGTSMEARARGNIDHRVALWDRANRAAVHLRQPRAKPVWNQRGSSWSSRFTAHETVDRHVVGRLSNFVTASRWLCLAGQLRSPASLLAPRGRAKVLLERREVWSAPALQRVLGAAGGSEPAPVPEADGQRSRAAGGCCCVHRWRCLQSWRKRAPGDEARAARGAIRGGTWKDRSFVVRQPDTGRIGSGAQGRWPGPARGWTDRRPLRGIRRAVHRFATVPRFYPSSGPGASRRTTLRSSARAPAP